MRFPLAFARAAGASLLAAVLCMPLAAYAAQTSLTGTVETETHTAVAGATVTLTGNNLNLTQVTDKAGHFTFSGLQPATYSIFAKTPSMAARVNVDLSSSGSAVTVTLLREISAVHTSTLPSIHGGGTDVTVNQTVLSRSASPNNFSSVLLQTPGAARGANGVVHINGDHGDINYVVDGVPVPQELNRPVGAEFDPSDVSFVEVLQGAYAAQYGGRFASVVNISTKANGTVPGFDGYTTAGSFGHVDSSLGYHGRIGKGSYVANVRAEQSDRFLDPPNPNSPHDRGSNVNMFYRLTMPVGKDYYNFTISNSHDTFEIPNDVAGGEPAATNDFENQNDLFAAWQFHHALRGGGSLAFGAGFKRSNIADFGDAANDFIYGEHLTLAAGGSTTSCASGVVSACGFSLTSNRTARDLTVNLDDDNPSETHDLRFGALYDAAWIAKEYNVTLQPGNFLAPVVTPLAPNGATTVTDVAPNIGHSESLYAQDGWKFAKGFQLDYGLRYDAFTLFSSEFSRFYDQLSPRVKLTKTFNQRSSVYAYYGRFFTPFSFENVSPSAAQLLNLPNQQTVAQFDLKPQRDSDYEIGGHIPFAAGALGLRIMQKNATDVIDDTQVGTTNLHQDINYAQGRVAVQTAYYQQSLPRAGRLYMSLTHARAVNKGCETQLLAPCFGSSTDWTQADHDQTWDASGGLLLNNGRNGWLSLDGEYGSGLSSANCGVAVAFCKVPPHLTFDAEKGIALRPGLALTVGVQNLLNDRYMVTFLNAQGNHYAPPRAFEIGLQFGNK